MEKAPEPSRGRVGLIYAFGDCELDEQLCELRCAGEPRHVEPQVFDVLLHLVRHPDRVVTRDELLDRIWGHRFVTPSTVSARIKSARRAVGDDGKAQRIIRTIRGRGFRLAVPVEVRGIAEAPGATRTGSREVDPSVVARAEELGRLGESFEAVLMGSRRLVLVSGESGIGKTTLVDAFTRAAEKEGVLVGRGQSIEQGGSGEPYLPVLDALGRLVRGPHREHVIGTLREYAPTWMAQMPSLLGSGQAMPVDDPRASATRDRMLREIVDALEALGREVPLILLLEDLHWADRSTLDLLLWLTPRSDPARLLVLGTYRTGAVGPELRTLVRKLRRFAGVDELELRPWSSEGVSAYLGARFEAADLPAELPGLVLDRSAGNPLFVKSLCDQWVERGDLAEEADGWRLVTHSQELGSDLPTSLHDSIELQIGGLDEPEQDILEAASVLGAEFLSAVVAAAVDRPDEEVERCCTTLARDGTLIRQAGAQDLPDRTHTARFAFAHHLYLEALYGRIPPQRRIRLHRRAGRRLEAAYGADAPEHASELALHFTRGRDPDAAVRWLTVAARRALRQSAHHEAVRHLERALELLESGSLEDSLGRELELQQLLAPARLEIGGWDDPGAEQAYRRAKEIAAELEDAANVGRALYGLAYLHEVRGEYPRAQAMLKERIALSESRPDPWSVLEAYDLLGCSLFHEGKFRDAMTSAQEAVRSATACGPGDDANVSLHHPAVSSRYWAATLHWCLGSPDRALTTANEARRIAIEVGHVPTLVFAEVRLARIHQFRREAAECAHCAGRALDLADEHGLPYQRSVALTLYGWAEAARGDAETGIARIREGLALQEDAGTVMDYPYGLALLSEALLLGGEATGALEAASRGLGAVERLGGKFFWSAELERFRGVASARLCDTGPAEEAFLRAAEVAREQGSPPLELRALVSLTGVQELVEPETRLRIEALVNGFSEGPGTADLREARARLDDLTTGPQR